MLCATGGDPSEHPKFEQLQQIIRDAEEVGGFFITHNRQGYNIVIYSACPTEKESVKKGLNCIIADHEIKSP